ETLYSPADFIETANTFGMELYSKLEPRKFGRGMDLHTQSNPLPICYRPGILVKLTMS
ncbi:MAG: major capsid protein, partial [Proteobacteria bacterium]|nr:major capsid protein [Pseudomonadota bacterium]